MPLLLNTCFKKSLALQFFTLEDCWEQKVIIHTNRAELRINAVNSMKSHGRTLGRATAYLFPIIIIILS